MMIRRENSASDGGKRNEQSDLSVARENFCEFLRRNYFELGIGAIAGAFSSDRHRRKCAM